MGAQQMVVGSRGRCARGAAVALLGLALMAADPAPAQAPAASAPDSSTTPTAPRPYPTGEIATESDVLQRLLRAVAREVDPDPPVADVLAGLPARADRVARERRVTERHLTVQLPEPIHREQRHRWDRLIAALDRDAATLADHVARLEDLRDQLGELQVRWRLTRDHVLAVAAPAVTVDAVHANLQAIAATTRRLVGQRDLVLAGQADLAESRRTAARERARVDDWLRQHANRMLDTRQAPLWRALDQQLADPSLGDRLELLAGAYAEMLRGQRVDWGVQIAVRVALLVLLVLLARRLGTRVRDRAAVDPELESAAHLLRRPLATATLVFVMGMILIDPLATRLVTEVLVIVVLVPLLGLVSRVTAPALRRWIYAAAGLYLLWRLAGLAPADMLLPRLLLLGLGLAALAATLGFRRALLPEDAAQGRGAGAWLLDRDDLRHRVVPPGLTAAAVLMLAAVVANLLGYAGPARILTRGVVVGIQLAILLRFLVLVLNGLLAVALRGGLASRSRILARHGAAVRASLVRALSLASWAVWLVAALQLFGIWEPVSRSLVAILFATLSVRDVSISLADVVAFLGVIWLSFVVSRWLRALLDVEFLPRLALPRGVPNTMSRVTHYLVLFVGFMLAVNLAGFDLDRFTLLIGAFGVGIGFGLQNVVNNFISGLILLFERPVQVSDRVQVGSMLGFIEHIGIRASVIRTFEGAEVIVPNGQLISDVVTNWTLSDRMRRIDIAVGVTYGTDPQRVLTILRDVAAAHPDVLSHPEPSVLFVAFGESSLDFSLRAWTPDYEEFLRVGSELRVQVWHALKDAGIEIPFPQRDLHLRSVPPLQAPPADPAPGAAEGD